MSQPAEVVPLRPTARSEAPQTPLPLVLAENIRRRVKVLACDPLGMAILLSGETGTGKTSLAEYIHELSPRSRGPFVSVNGAVLSGNLVLSDLFGHERGAFTGASRSRAGLLAQAHGGTIFLDDLAAMPPETQAQLLDVVERGRYRRVGADQELSVDVRVIAAINEDPRMLIDRRALRSDLFSRLIQGHIHLPALKESQAILDELIDSIFQRYAEQYRIYQIDSFARQLMKEQQWVGNIRELDSVIRQACLFAQAVGMDTISAAILEDVIQNSMTGLLIGTREAVEDVCVDPLGADHPPVEAAGERGLKARVRAFERAVIVEALRANKWNISHAARALDLQRAYLYEKMRNFGIERPAEGAEDLSK